MSTVLVWYVSYGSNMHAERLACYLVGGVAPGAKRRYPGCRDTDEPRASRGCLLPGGVYFATESAVWGGGRAFYDPMLPGTAPARAYLITAAQFSDIAAQEMYREPDVDLDLTEVLSCGRACLGPGRYETLLHAGDHDGYPMLTFTAPWSATEVDLLAPSAGYLRMLGHGLRAGHGWDVREIANYLAGLPGAAGVWSAAEVAALLEPGSERGSAT